MRLHVAIFHTCNHLTDTRRNIGVYRGCRLLCFLPATYLQPSRRERGTDSAEQSAKKRGAGGKVGEALTRSRTHHNAPELLQGKHSTRGAGGAQRATSRASEHNVVNHDGNKQSDEKARTKAARKRRHLHSDSAAEPGSSERNRGRYTPRVDRAGLPHVSAHISRRAFLFFSP